MPKLLIFAVLSIGVSIGFAGAAPRGKIGFNRDIRPILSENCFQCHGPDPGSREADLRFDREDGLFGDRDEGAAVVPGDPEASLLFQRIVTGDPDEIMPPPETHKSVTPGQAKLVRRWIEEGARWEDHWSFIKPRRPGTPKVNDPAWAWNPIDRFILKGLEEADLEPADPADRGTHARRLSLDVTGLPPAPEWVDRFVNDRDPGALDRYLDRLFASPHHGEHMARYWLDAARYADTHGLHFDNYREMWPYRDWVIRAFNRNMSFDQFTVEQLAGDLLPEPTLEQRVATGFHRCNITTNEGGVIDEEVAVMYAQERVETTGTVFLGLTLGCAVCHEHKFDPVSMKDFYSMSAYFRNLTQKPRDGNISNTPPVVRVPSKMEERRLADLEERKSGAQERLNEREAELEPEAVAWVQKARPDMFAHPVDVTGLEFYLPLKAGQGHRVWNAASGDLVPIILPESASWVIDERQGPQLQWKEGAGIAGDVAKVERDEAFSFGAWVKTDKDSEGAVFARMDVKSAFRGWDLWIEDGGRKFGMHLIHRWGEDAIKVLSRDRVIAPGKWNHVFVSYDGSGKAGGVSLYRNGKRVPVAIQRDQLEGSITTDVPVTIGARMGGSELKNFSVEDIRFYRRSFNPVEVESLAGAREMRRLAGLPEGKEGRNAKLRDYYYSQNDPVWAERKAGLRKIEEEYNGLTSALPVTHVMQENQDGMTVAHVLERGNYDQPGEQVHATVIESLHPLPDGALQNRMGLARWIVSEDNSLTARVTVNRLWQQVFGTGLVRTAGDFGIMGENPSHPELLDWLAVEFLESGWDVRHILRLMLTSRTYAQSARTTPEKLEKDPANRLLSRGPRFRLDAEMVRDSALAASGLLVRKIGGPSVKPYQPEGVWAAVAMPNSNTKLYREDDGEKLYRRSLYTFWKRAAPPASMEILNAPSREICTVQRERTNTPLQALVTLNDPQMVEAARHLAQRAMRAELHTEARLDFMTRTVLARSFDSFEQKIALESFSQFADFYRQHLEEAGELIEVGASPPDPSLNAGQLAAWTMVANQILNLDEALNK